ncbi:MAG: SH3 domain-containing protein [Candidatus Rifleibacteriota bacterium]
MPKSVCSFVLVTALCLGFTIGIFAADCSCSDDKKVFVQFDLNIPGVTHEMLSPDFWIKLADEPDKLIMTPAQIELYNRRNFRECAVMKDYRTFPRILSGKKVIEMIEKVSFRPKSKRYLNGLEIGDVYFQNLEQACNKENLPNLMAVRYGITVKRTEMRAFPTFDRVFSEPDDIETDRFIETAIYPIEPLVIIHESLDRKWYFAQAYNYLAWVPAEAVALTDRKTLDEYLAAKNYIVVTGKGVFTAFNPVKPEISELRLDMGVRVPLAERDEIPMDIDGQHPAGNYVVKLPVRNSAGNLEFRLGLIARADDVRVGYLPYTRRNIIKQAFKFLGQRYGWGGMFNTRDCSAFIMDNFRSMGIMLPRNAGEQGKMAVGITHAMPKDMPLEERMKILDQLQATPIYMNGHAMLYLGKYAGDYYIIHDFAGFRAPDDQGKMKSSKTRCVFVTPLLTTFLSSGKKYMEGLYAAREFRLEK